MATANTLHRVSEKMCKPTGWRGNVDDQNELFLHILTRYLWYRVSCTFPVCNNTVEKWCVYAPRYFQQYWDSMQCVYQECLRRFGVEREYVPVMAFYDWKSLFYVARKKVRFADLEDTDVTRRVTLSYQWDAFYGTAIMRVVPADEQTLCDVLKVAGSRYCSVDILLDYVFVVHEDIDGETVELDFLNIY